MSMAERNVTEIPGQLPLWDVFIDDDEEDELVAHAAPIVDHLPPPDVFVPKAQAQAISDYIDKVFNLTNRSTILDQAKTLINGDRAQQYGDARDTHKRIAQMWNAVVPGCNDISVTDVALMMVCVKVIRATRTPSKADSWIDIAGYAALGAEFASAK